MKHWWEGKGYWVDGDGIDSDGNDNHGDANEDNYDDDDDGGGGGGGGDDDGDDDDDDGDDDDNGDGDEDDNGDDDSDGDNHHNHYHGNKTNDKSITLSVWAGVTVKSSLSRSFFCHCELNHWRSASSPFLTCSLHIALLLGQTARELCEGVRSFPQERDHLVRHFAHVVARLVVARLHVSAKIGRVRQKDATEIHVPKFPVITSEKISHLRALEGRPVWWTASDGQGQIMHLVVIWNRTKTKLKKLATGCTGVVRSLSIVYDRAYSNFQRSSLYINLHDIWRGGRCLETFLRLAFVVLHSYYFSWSGSIHPSRKEFLNKSYRFDKRCQRWRGNYAEVPGKLTPSCLYASPTHPQPDTTHPTPSLPPSIPRRSASLSPLQFSSKLWLTRLLPPPPTSLLPYSFHEGALRFRPYRFRRSSDWISIEVWRRLDDRLRSRSCLGTNRFGCLCTWLGKSVRSPGVISENSRKCCSSWRYPGQPRLGNLHPCCWEERWSSWGKPRCRAGHAPPSQTPRSTGWSSLRTAFYL